MPPRRSPTTRRERAQQVRSLSPPERQADRRAIKEEREFRDFLAATGRSDTDPYGNESSFPFKSANYVQPDTPGGLTREGVATLNRQAFDKFNKPFAKRSIFGRDVGGDMLRGKVRSDIRPDTLTRFGRTEAAPSSGGFFSGIANLIPVIGTAMRRNQPATLPGFNTVPGFNQGKLDQLQRLGPNLGTSTEPTTNTFGEIGRGDVEVVSPLSDSSTLDDSLPDELAFKQGMGRVPLTYDDIVASGAASDALLDLSNRRNLANTLLSDIDAQAEVKREQDRRALASELAETLGIRAAQRTLGDAPLPVPPPERVTPPVMSPLRENRRRDLAVSPIASSEFFEPDRGFVELPFSPDVGITSDEGFPEAISLTDAAAFERFRDQEESNPNNAAEYDAAIANSINRIKSNMTNFPEIAERERTQGNASTPGETLQTYNEGLDYLQNIGMADPQFAPIDGVKNRYDENIPSLEFEGAGPLDAYMDRLLMADDTGIYMDPDIKNSRSDVKPLAYGEEGILMTPMDMMGAYSNIAPNLSASEFLRETGISAEQLLELQQNRPDIYNELFSTDRGLSRQMNNLIDREQGV